MNAPTVIILKGHVLDKLKELSDSSIQCCVTSPPYWGLRDYSRCECAATYDGGPHSGYNIKEGHLSPRPKEPDSKCPKCHGTGKDDSLTVVWDAKEGCEHEWGDEMLQEEAHPRERPDLPNPPAGWSTRDVTVRPGGGSFCRLCNAWRGQLGLEPTPDLYVQHIVQVFREVKRVLRDDGTLWLNLGDSYAGGGGVNYGSGLSTRGGTASYNPTKGKDKPDVPPGLKPKDLVGMPWRVAFALQADGWHLRSDIIWAKPNPMPESVTDRPTKAHEYVFLLTKSARYFYDSAAVREAQAESTTERERYHYPNPVDNPNYDSKHQEGDFRRFPIQGKKHTPKGASRELEGLRTPERMGHGPGWRKNERWDDKPVFGRNLRTVWTIATQPYSGAHFATFPEALVERCIKAGTRQGDTVLDPFGGSGTVGQVARSLGRSSILIEIKEQYIELMKDRVDYAHKTLDGFS